MPPGCLPLPSSYLLLATLLFGAPLAGGVPATKPALGSTVFPWDQMPSKPTPNGATRSVANQPTATLATFECHLTTLLPGRASHAPHRHPQEELIVVKEGTLEVSINGERRQAGPGATLFYAANDAHGVRNVGEGPATYFVVNLATPATHQVPLPSPTWDGPATLRSGVFDGTQPPAKPTKVGARRDVLNQPTITLANLESHVTTVNPGLASHAPHRHPDEEILLVREGTLEVTIGDRVQTAGAGSVVFLASGDLHGLRNPGPTPVTYHVIRVVTAATPKAATP